MTKLIPNDFPFLSQELSHKVTIMSMDKADTSDIEIFYFSFVDAMLIAFSVIERLTNHSIFPH